MLQKRKKHSHELTRKNSLIRFSKFMIQHGFTTLWTQGKAQYEHLRKKWKSSRHSFFPPTKATLIFFSLSPSLPHLKLLSSLLSFTHRKSKQRPTKTFAFSPPKPHFFFFLLNTPQPNFLFSSLPTSQPLFIKNRNSLCFAIPSHPEANRKKLSLPSSLYFSKCLTLWMAIAFLLIASRWLPFTWRAKSCPFAFCDVWRLQSEEKSWERTLAQQ